MGVFKNDVGRPSNEIIRKRNILKCVIGVLVIIIFLIFAYIINDKFNNEPIKENSETQENQNNENNEPIKENSETQEKEDVVNKTLNIYGYTNEATNYNDKNIYIRDSQYDQNDLSGNQYVLLGTYTCTSEDCNLFKQISYDLTTVVIKDGDYLSYNFKTKESNKFNLGDYKNKIDYIKESSCDGMGAFCIESRIVNNSTYYEMRYAFDEPMIEILIGPDYDPIIITTDEEVNGENYYENASKNLYYAENGNILYSKGNKYYTYNSKTKNTKPSKGYKTIVKITNEFITVLDTDNILKVLDINGNLKANLGKMSDDVFIHSLLSGWYEENKKEGIYIVVGDPSVKFEQLSEKLKKELNYDPSGMDYGYEYYYIPKTGETGRIAIYIGGYAKPVLYLYPKTDNSKITVNFAKPELLTTSYPKFKDKWIVTANKNGDLKDLDGKYYYGLYWEEKGHIDVDFNTGFYVTKENAITFLEEKLSIIGLNDRERNEFIMYWLPVLEKNEKSLVYFELTSSRESFNKLIINPKPDSLLRMAIHVKKVNDKVNIKEQHLPTFERKGFTAVEWGGVIH